MVPLVPMGRPDSSVGSAVGFSLARYLCHAGSNPVGDAIRNVDYWKKSSIIIIPAAVVCINGLTVTFRVAVVSQGISRRSFPAES